QRENVTDVPSQMKDMLFFSNHQDFIIKKRRKLLIVRSEYVLSFHCFLQQLNLYQAGRQLFPYGNDTVVPFDKLGCSVLRDYHRRNIVQHIAQTVSRMMAGANAVGLLPPNLESFGVQSLRYLIDALQLAGYFSSKSN